MDFSTVTAFSTRKKSDMLVVPFWEDKKVSLAIPEVDSSLDGGIQAPIAAKDFVGKVGRTVVLYSDDPKEARIALLGLGKKKECSVEQIRRAYSAVVKLAQKYRTEKITVFVPTISSLQDHEIMRGLSEGLLLPNYAYEQLKHEMKEPTTLIKKVCLVGATKRGLDVAQRAKSISDGVFLARNLVNGNADEITPQYLASIAKKFARLFPEVKTQVFDKKRIQKEKMGLLLAVNRGSGSDPVLIISQYRGNPGSKDHTVIVGKGVTFDTGGLNLKPTGHMETMKSDMAGAATALGTLYVMATLGFPINMTVVVPSTENAVGPQSFKPGDVYKSYMGKTVEVGNTDAEGRLILADALAYAVGHLKPTRIIDFATLTGAIVIALGEEVIGLFSNDDALANSLINAGESSFERLHRFPLYQEYREQLKSDFADIKNIGGREGGSITAAKFLEEFVGKTPWAHLDIAGTAYRKKKRDYNPQNGTGAGVRLMVDFLCSLGTKKK